MGPTQRSAILINPAFARLWAGQSLSGLGDAIFETTLVVWIVTDLAEGRGWSSLAVSGILIASAIPVLLVGPVAGVLVDRWHDKRRIMLRADLSSAVLILSLLPTAGIASLSFLPNVPDGQLPLAVRLTAIFAVVFLASAIAQFFRPASSVLLRDIVPEAERARAMGLNQASSSLSLLIGPPLAAPLLIAFGASWALVINAATFLASFLLIRTIPAPSTAHPAPAIAASPKTIARELAEGLRFFRHSPVLRTIAVALVIVTFGLGALNALDVFFVTENLGTPTKYYGILSAAFGGGMILGAIVSGVLANRIGLERTVWASLVAIGLLIVVYARLTSFVPAVLVIAGLGLVVPAANVSIGPILLRETPRELTGRVSATLNPLINGASILGILAGGFLYGTLLRDFRVDVVGITFGPLDTLFVGVGLLCLLGGAYARANLRSTRSEQSASPADAAD